MSPTESSSFLRFIYGAIGMMSLFMAAHEKHHRERDEMHAKMHPLVENMDFIIVGGGTAGLVLANRLSENYRVLVLEAGGNPFPLTRIPAFTPYLMNQKETDWMFKTVPQKEACQAMKNKITNICQGKGLGGSSNLGFMNFNRGSPFDFENWANITGDSSWKYTNILPFFRRMENYKGYHPDKTVHGSDGELPLRTPNYTGMAGRFLKAAQEMGYKMADLNGFFTEGFDVVVSPMRRGYRQNTASSFYNRIRARSRLQVQRYATVLKLLMSKDAANVMSAYGVIFERHGQLIMAVAQKEVILAAGAVNTPRLLMKGGIGPKEDLEKLNITVLKDLPVGENLQDHLITYLGPFTVNSTGKSFLVDRDLTPNSVAKFGLINGQGPMTSTGQHANGLIISSNQKIIGNVFWPDIQLIMYGIGHHGRFDRDMTHMFNMNETIAGAFFNETKGMDSFSIIVSGARPYSRGKVRLSNPSNSSSTTSSGDGNFPVEIDPRYLSHPRDMQTMVDGIHRALSLVENTKAFQQLGAKLYNRSFPACEDYEFRSRRYWECYVREFSMSANHLVGSCAMGKFASTSVVDSRFRVRGVRNLRVVDASVMPSIPVAGPMAATMLIAEKGADVIKNYWDSMRFMNLK